MSCNTLKGEKAQPDPYLANLGKTVVKTCEIGFPPLLFSLFVHVLGSVPSRSVPEPAGAEGTGHGRALSLVGWEGGQTSVLKHSNKCCTTPREMSGHLFCSNCSKNK